MIRGLIVTNHNNESLELDLFHPEWSGLIIDNIEGMGPPKANVNYNEVATIDGGIFTSARATARNLVITLSMMFDPQIEDTRLKTYKYFPIKKPISVELITDYRHAICYGYVESNTPNVFSDHEQAQISIICPDPYFYEMEQSVYIFSGVMPMFEFPFWNDSFTENLLEFGDIREDNRATLEYKGDVDTGVLITCHVMTDTVENLVIWNTETREHMRIDTDKIRRLTDIQFSQGDDIIINTKIGEKSIHLLSGGKYYNIISCIEKDADWFQLTTGFNTFTFVAEHGEANMRMEITYRNAYGGV